MADVNRMQKCLAVYGFSEMESIVGTEATRQRIIAALEHLQVTTEEEDVIVIYFSGHGISFSHSVYNDGKMLRFLDEGLLPSDIGIRSIIGDNRGWTENESAAITGDDINPIIQQLVEEKKAVVILLSDCCHSGRISRKWPSCGYPKVLSLESNRVRLNPPCGKAKWMPGGNDKFVHIGACSHLEVAEEVPAGDGTWGGALTLCLDQLLQQSGGAGRTFGDLIRQLLPLMKQRGYAQTPQIEGQAGLRLFDSTIITDKELIPAAVVLESQRVSLRRGGLHGVCPGVYQLLTTIEPNRIVGTCLINKVQERSSEGQLQDPNERMKIEQLPNDLAARYVEPIPCATVWITVPREDGLGHEEGSAARDRLLALASAIQGEINGLTFTPGVDGQPVDLADPSCLEIVWLPSYTNSAGQWQARRSRRGHIEDFLPPHDVGVHDNQLLDNVTKFIRSRQARRIPRNVNELKGVELALLVKRYLPKAQVKVESTWNQEPDVTEVQGETISITHC
jgi:hypothetical protein